MGVKQVSAVARRASGTKEDAKAINAYLDTLHAKVHEIHQSLISDEQEISAQKINKRLTGVSKRPKMILEISTDDNNN